MKLQFWSFDVIFAMIIFSFAITILAFVWYSINNQFSLSYGYGVASMQMQVQGLAARLLTPGMPTDWSSIISINTPSTWSNISIGLLGSNNELSLQKIATLESMTNYNYQATKQAMGIGYDYYIVISSQGISIPIGSNPYANNALTIQVINEPISINGAPGNMRVLVWTNMSFGVS
jgi:hypothetical protein